jgi:chromate reductase
LRQSLVFLDMPTLQQPEAYIGGADKLLDSHGALANENTREFLTTYMRRFADWIARHAVVHGDA